MLQADVIIYGSTGLEETGRIEDVFRSFQLSARVEAVTRGQSDLSWFILTSLPTRILFDQAGADGPAQLRELTCSLTQCRSPSGLLLLQDTETGIQVVLEPDLPEDAYRSLRAVDLARFTFGPLHYDTKSVKWRSQFDEWT